MNNIQKVADRYLQAIRRFHFDRSFYLPDEVRDIPPTFDHPEGTDLQIWTWEGTLGMDKGKPYAIAFNKAQSKPVWYHSFSSVQSRDKHVQDTITAYKAIIERKKKILEERRVFQHNFKEGDILVSSWGYDQTNIDFYQVTKIIGKAIEIREIEKKMLSGKSNAYQDAVVPVPNHFSGPPMRKIPKNNDCVGLTSFSSACKWDGNPEFETNSIYGH
jgi:hypothetical protein